MIEKIASKNMSYFQKGDFRRRWSQCRTRRQRDGSESRRQSSFLLQPPSFHTYPRGNTYQNMNPMVNTSGSQSGSSYCDRKNYQCLPVEANPYPNGYHTGQGSPLNNYYQNVPSSIYQGPHYPSYHEQASSSALPCYHYGNYPDSYSYSYVSPSQGQIMEPLPSEQVLIQSPHRTADRQSQERVRDPPDHSMSTIINKL
ncbi:hypothetical protein MXB_4583 [Myxobolus squamalis]|nr:hypothetical protein MXB_4583 [Myxobolus squamalis]